MTIKAADLVHRQKKAKIGTVIEQHQHSALQRDGIIILTIRL